MEVSNNLGAGFLESVYQNALGLALASAGFFVEAQKPTTVLFRDIPVGKFYADLVVENKIILELKAARALVPEHRAQLINYLKASGIEVGLLLNFGNPRLEYHRLVRTKPATSDSCPR
jgi:GxxExxY protein